MVLFQPYNLPLTHTYLSTGTHPRSKQLIYQSQANMNCILGLLAGHRNDLVADMLPVISHRDYHDLRDMLPSDACRALLWDHVVCRNLWNKFENALKKLGLYKSWQDYFD